VVEFRWVPQDAGGADLEPSASFATQAEAEAWMGEEWSSLLERGAEHVKLVADGNVVYRMGLREQ
jgi:hypothetical protein